MGSLATKHKTVTVKMTTSADSDLKIQGTHVTPASRGAQSPITRSSQRSRKVSRDFVPETKSTKSVGSQVQIIEVKPVPVTIDRSTNATRIEDQEIEVTSDVVEMIVRRSAEIGGDHSTTTTATHAPATHALVTPEQSTPASPTSALHNNHAHQPMTPPLMDAQNSEEDEDVFLKDDQSALATPPIKSLRQQRLEQELEREQGSDDVIARRISQVLNCDSEIFKLENLANNASMDACSAAESEGVISQVSYEVANPDNLNMSSESSLQKIEMHSTVVKRSKLKFPNEEGSTASSSKTKNKSCQEEDNDSSSNELDDATSLQRSEVNQTSSPVQEVNLSDVDCLPSIDTVEATHACMIRLRQILKYLPEGNISSEDLKMNLEYTASVLEKVYMDETKYRDKYDGNKTPSLIKDEKPRTTRLKGKGRRRVHKVPELTPPPEHSTIQLSQAEIDHNSNVTIKRRLCDDDDELSEVEPDVVPSEVRDWLALTFTRSMSNMKRRRNQKPKFRSVAQAIRAGIMVDKIYRRMSSSVGLHVPPTVLMMLKNMDDWSFDMFAVTDASEGHSLKYVGYELLQRYDLIRSFKINTQTLDNFLLRMEQGYSKYSNPYHNLTHAADVAQTTHYIITHCGLMLWLSDLEIFATIIAAIIHDFEHTGTTNNFHINTSSDLSIMYNDRAVLENYHVSSVFRILKDDDLNILSGLKKEEYRDFRGLVIDMVLATDMSYHFQQIKNMKSLISLPENMDKSKAMSLVIHCADISHPAKTWEIHHRWTTLLLEEFFLQGDKETELGLPITPLCDRKNTLVAESQIGFIDFIVDPSFQVMGDMLEKIIDPLRRRNNSVQRCMLEDVPAPSTPTPNSAPQSAHSSAPTPAPQRNSHNRTDTNVTPGDVNSSASSSSAGGACLEVDRIWVELLNDNKTKWKEQAVIDAIERKAAADEAAGDGSNDPSDNESPPESAKSKPSKSAEITKDSGTKEVASKKPTEVEKTKEKSSRKRSTSANRTTDNSAGDLKTSGK